MTGFKSFTPSEARHSVPSGPRILLYMLSRSLFQSMPDAKPTPDLRPG